MKQKLVAWETDCSEENEPNIRTIAGARERIQQLKVLAAKSDELTLVPQDTWGRRKRSNYCKLSSDLSM